MNILRFILLLFAFLVSTAKADDALKFGPEFTFTNTRILANLVRTKEVNTVNSEFLKPYIDALEKTLIQYCKKNKECTLYRFSDFKLIIESKDFYINYSTDPGAVEITMSPMSVETFKKNKDLFQKLIFDSCQEAHLYPSQWIGSGHISIGYEYFLKRKQLMKDFMFDYFNHNELATVIFENDIYNAPVVTKLPNENMENLMKIAKEFSNQNPLDIEEFLNRIDEDVYLERKYNAFNLSTLYDEKDETRKRIEIRGHRSQKDFGEFIDIIAMYEARLNYLEKNPNVKLAIKDYDSLDMRVGSIQFKKYIQDSGLLWRDYRKFVPTKKESIIRKSKNYFLIKFNDVFNCSIDLHQPKNFDEWVQE